MSRRPLLAKLALAGLSIALTVVLLEVVVRVVAPQPIDYFTYEKNPAPGSEIEKWGVPIRYNSTGHRDSEYPRSKPADTYRIALIGDSIEFGTGVLMAESYGKIVERELNAREESAQDFEVLVFSQGGDEPSGYLEMMRDEAVPFSPDLVLIGLTLNDFERPTYIPTTREYLYALLAEAHQQLRVRSHLYFLLIERSRDSLYRTGVLDRSVRHKYFLDGLETKGQAFESAWAYTQTVLDDIIAQAEAMGARVGFVVFPYEMQLSQDLLELYRDTYGYDMSERVLEARPQALLAKWAQERNVAFLDFTPIFRENSAQGLYFREFGGSLDYVHPNASGHRLAGEQLVGWLRERRLAGAQS
ncbi:MAG: SGNH/GDSL hydrolase family protein [Candidatus Binatia bacterium]|nr:SGNH/GDSL hydrolase family protein [Candidatus Binatia bacterium]